MHLQLERMRKHLINTAQNHEPMKAYIDLLIMEYDKQLESSLRQQVDFLHRAQRLIKLAITQSYKNETLFKKVLMSPDPSWANMKSLQVNEDLKHALANQLFLSSGAKAGEKIIIATTESGRDIVEILIKKCLQNTVDFELGIKDPLRMVYLINELDKLALKAMTDLSLERYEGVKREIILTSYTDPFVRNQLDQQKMTLYKKMNETLHNRAMSGDLHYTLTRIPNQFDAALEEMDPSEYLELFFELCDQPWSEIEKAQDKLIEVFDLAKEIHITNEDGTDIRLNITGQSFANSVVAKNIPGSEIFSSPLREGVDGVIIAKGRFQYGSEILIEDIELHFEKGRVEKYSARVGQEALAKIIRSDDDHGEGTRYLGEIGIGTNPHLRRHVLNRLLVEKIGGSFHIALGACYTYEQYLGVPVKLQNGNTSFSGTHWDITTMLRKKNGKIEIDGKLIQSNGDWIGEDYRVLNEGWGVLSKDQQPKWWKERYLEGY